MSIQKNINNSRKKIISVTGKAIKDFTMIAKGDKIMVCISGGKDSYTMLEMFIHFQKYGNIDFEFIVVNMDQKQPGFPTEILPKYLTDLGVDFKIIEKDTYSIVKDKIPEGKTMCSLCSRLRRGTLYDTARELKCNKIALGHHMDDIIETYFLNLFFSGKMEAMPPKYVIDKKDLMVIRPLSYCKEGDIQIYSDLVKHPIIPCNLCGSQTNLQRKKIKELIKEWELIYPNRKAIIFNSLQNISPSHLLDRNIFDFDKLQPVKDANLFV
tara:strand:- start:135 stop:938 length:804 start_codon:yes stop_codon:yes gene_type:complete